MAMREEYQALMEKQLAEWKIQGERIKAGAQQLEAQAKAQFDKNLELLRGKQAEAWDHFQKMKAAHEGTWAQTKVHLEKAGEEIKAAVEQLTKSSKGK
jgi:DNA mismatch repair ATPase MutS